MERGNNCKNSVKVSEELKEVLYEFTMMTLLDQPTPVERYARKYFDKLNSKHTPIEYDLRQEQIKLETLECFSEEKHLQGSYYQRRREQVVFSEAYNPEKDEDKVTEIVMHYKSKEHKDSLREKIKKCLLFRSLDSENLEKVVGAMVQRIVLPGDVVIKEGDDGDNFYIIEMGVFKVFQNGKYLSTYPVGGSFGELSLMYNTPRAATIISAKTGILWSLDRDTFRKIVVKNTFRKRKLYEGFLANVTILQELQPYERSNLADALVPKKFKQGAKIIKAGDIADGMYFIEKGTVDVIVSRNGRSKKVHEIGEGGYFGELSLMTKEPRAATVLAASGEVKCAFLDAETFERMLGPCMDILKRNVDFYEEVINRQFWPVSDIATTDKDSFPAII